MSLLILLVTGPFCFQLRPACKPPPRPHQANSIVKLKLHHVSQSILQGFSSLVGVAGLWLGETEQVYVLLHVPLADQVDRGHGHDWRDLVCPSTGQSIPANT